MERFVDMANTNGTNGMNAVVEREGEVKEICVVSKGGIGMREILKRWKRSRNLKLFRSSKDFFLFYIYLKI